MPTGGLSTNRVLPGKRSLWVLSFWAALAIPPAGLSAAAEPSWFAPLDPPPAVAIVWDQQAEPSLVAGTTAALETAIEDLLPWVAVSLATTRDGALVLSDGTAAEAAQIAAQPLAALGQQDLGAARAPRLAGRHRATLDEALVTARGRLNLLLTCASLEQARAAAAAIAQAGLSSQVMLRLGWCTSGDEFHSSAAQLTRQAAQHTEQAPEVGLLFAAPRREFPSAVLGTESESQSRGAEAIDSRRRAVLLPLGSSPAEQPANSPELVAAWKGKGYWVALSDPWPEGELAREDWTAALAAQPDAIVSRRGPIWRARAVASAAGRKRVQVALHRGANRYRPENTLPALELAVDLGADWIEIDLQSTRDGVAFLLHDRQLDRTTGARGLLSQRTAAEAALLDAGSWLSGQPAPLPRAEDVLAAWAKDPRFAEAKLYLDAKGIPPEELGKLIARYGLEDRSVVFQAPGYLERLRRANPRARLMPPLYQANAAEALAGQLRPYAFDTAWEILSPELIARCHEFGVKVFSDALGDHERVADYRQAIGWGIDVIQTDHPLRLWRAIELEVGTQPSTVAAP